MFQMRDQTQWKRVRLENSVEVFDPFSRKPDGEFEKTPPLLPERGYVQIIHWQDNRILTIETRDKQGQLLHLFYENEDQQAEWSLDSVKPFSRVEVMPHYLRFLSRKPRNRVRALREMNITDFTVSRHWSREGYALYKVGLDNSGHYALFDQKTFRLQSLHGTIVKKDGTEWRFRVEFRNFKKYRRQYYPRITEYYLDDRLIKRVSLEKLRSLSKLPLKELNDLAKARVQQAGASITINYTR